MKTVSEDIIRNSISHYLKRNGFDAFSPRAVLFDMDGVLFDSMPLHANSWAKVCTEFGLSMTPTEAYMHEGRTGESTINILSMRARGRKATQEEIEAIYAEKCRLFNSLPEAPKMPGAEQTLEHVRDCGMNILVVTGSGQQSLLERLNTNYPCFFASERVVSSKDVKHGKPNPEPYLKGLEKAQVEPWEAIVIENAPLGVKAAVDANIFTIAVNTGPLPDSVLLEQGADMVLASMEELAHNIKHIINTQR